MFKTNDDYTVETIDTGLPLHEIPFPAITICPETKAQKIIVNVTEAYHNIHLKNGANYGDEE
jgi:hypothetical protein